MNKYKRRNRSLRVFTWDGIKPTPAQTLVESTVVEWYSAKHREASQEEVAFVNSLRIDKCPYCDGTHFKAIQKFIFKAVSVLLVVAAVSVLIATFWLPVLKVYGSSMSPTMESGEVIVTVKSDTFKSGDIVWI